MRPLGDWSTAGRYPEGYEESGGSELIYRDGQLLGGLTADADGRPSIDIHGGDTPSGTSSARQPSSDDSDRTRASREDARGEGNR